MVIDRLMQSCSTKITIAAGRWPAGDRCCSQCLKVLAAPYFKLASRPRPRAGKSLAANMPRLSCARCGRAAKADVIATATALTAASMAHALKSYRLKKRNYRDWVVSGGGTKNAALMEMLRKEAEGLGLGCGIRMISAFPARQKKRWLLRFSRTRHGTDCREMCHRQPEPSDRRCWEKSPMSNRLNRKGPQRTQRTCKVCKHESSFVFLRVLCG